MTKSESDKDIDTFCREATRDIVCEDAMPHFSAFQRDTIKLILASKLVDEGWQRSG
jgi:hypothetical protein